MILDASPASRSKQRAEPPGRKMRKEERQESQRMGGSLGSPNGNKKKQYMPGTRNRGKDEADEGENRVDVDIKCI